MADMFFGLMALALLGGLGFGGFMAIRAGLRRLYGNTENPALLARMSLILKGALTLMLCLLAIVPLTLVQDLASEREGLYRDVVRDIGESWGEEQLLTGPVLVLPYRYAVLTEESLADGSRRQRRSTVEDELLILPKHLKMKADLKHDFRDRGIYHSLVYQSGVEGQASFDVNLPIISNLESFEFSRARLVFGLSANQAIDGVDSFVVSGEGPRVGGDLMSGTGLAIEALNRGFHRPLQLGQEHAPFTVDFKLRLRGSQGIGFLPLGEASEFSLSADWPHPSFTGILPSERNISADGFNASWNISHLSRNYPQIMRTSQGQSLLEARAHTQLFEPVTHYGKIERAIKYGLLFVALTFILLLMFELGQRQSLSPLQYLMVGAAMTLFYLLLLALSEHLGFGMAYVLAALVPVLSIPAYVASATQSHGRGVIMLAMLLGLYGLLYSILRLEDYALLMGSGLLLAVLLTLMFLTRRQSVPG